VKRRGELMAQAHGGGMAAVIGLSVEQVQDVLAHLQPTVLEIANINSPLQIVISGPIEAIVDAQDHFERAGAKTYMPLRVGGAFHSRFMAPFQDDFRTYLQFFQFAPLTLSVIANTTARPYDKEAISDYLVEQLVKPVRWTESIHYLLTQGVDEFIESRHSTVLTKLVKRIQQETPAEVLASLVRTESLPPVRQESQHLRMSRQWRLGDPTFQQEYGVNYAYVAGSMYRGISSPELVIRMGKAGLLAFFGSAGLPLTQVESAIKEIQQHLGVNAPYGVNLTAVYNDATYEEQFIDLLVRNHVYNLELAGYSSVTAALLRYRLNGLRYDASGHVQITHHLLVKVSRPEVAEVFLHPAPEPLLRKLQNEQLLSATEADLLRQVPMADDLCVGTDLGSFTDQGSAYILLPVIIRMRDALLLQNKMSKRVRVGVAGGIGTPEAAAAAFLLGADFILTGSINQCTVEAGTSPEAKQLLQQMHTQDTTYAAGGEMFEAGTKMQVLKKGVFFPFRANKLYDLYRYYNSLDDLPAKYQKDLQEKYFRRSFEDIYREVYASLSAGEAEQAVHNPRQRMGLVFKWYFDYSMKLAIRGDKDRQVDYQIPCSPALGAFNEWVKQTPLEHWQQRHVDTIALKLMEATGSVLEQRVQAFLAMS
jgi:trans-AT polyketide synthase, acyltransferase and oxidoreductase domains